MAKKKEILIEIGITIRERMKGSFKSNLALAIACEVDEKTIRNVLLGKNISIKLLKKICDSLEIRISDLFKEAGF